ncbi:diguanylate cyclase/phosphodiesterase (plasmid) [Ruegeria sp. TM1040]|nr:diguanylate cyclase/phosphodiesterase [Ruegeria sp. TM1040]
MLCGRKQQGTKRSSGADLYTFAISLLLSVLPVSSAAQSSDGVEPGVAFRSGLRGPDAIEPSQVHLPTSVGDALALPTSPFAYVLYGLSAIAVLAIVLAEVLRRVRRTRDTAQAQPVAPKAPETRPKGDSLALLDGEARVIDANRRFEYEAGMPLAQIRGRPIWSIHAKGFGKCFWDGAIQEALTEGAWQGEARTLSDDLHPETETLSLRAFNVSGADPTYEFRSRRSFRPKSDRAGLLDSGLRDALTGLPSRRAMKTQVEFAIVRAKAATAELAIILIDLDRFRDINSIFGDDIGDRVIERLADAVRSVMRPGITIGRIGGDEFILLIEQASSPEVVLQVAHDIGAALGDEVVVDGLTCRLSASMGIAQYPKDGSDQRNLMQAAGVSLCHAKAKGRGQICFYSENMEQRSEESLQMEHDLKRAISDGELLMFYQPQIDLRTGQCIGAEALLRWQHPKKGLLLPGGFVPLALDTGLTTAIDQFVTDEVCRQIRAWNTEGYAPAKISVNMSAMTLLSPDFARDLRSTARHHQVDLTQLEIEVLETTLFPRMRSSLNTVDDLRTMGVKLAIDDFGTGYSSLAMLKDLPIDRIKLDRRFITSLPENVKDDRIVAAVVAMGRSLGVSVIAEGVETREQRDRLISLGCAEAQGYLFSRPVPAAQFAETWLRYARPKPYVGSDA